MERKQPDLTYARKEINGSSYMCSDCITTAGELSKVFFCTYGIYIVLDNLKFPIRQTYQMLKEILKTPYIYIYVPQAGIYDYYSDKFKDNAADLDEDESYNQWLDGFVSVGADERYTDEDLKRIEGRLKLNDAENRGSYVDSDGSIYLKKGGKFVEASDIDSDSVFFACVFFGCIGAHRFKLRKYMSGLWYIFSFGLLGTGWLLDLLILILGIQKDKYGCVLLPVSDVRSKLKYIPIGIVINAIYVFAVIKLISHFA